MTVVFLKPPALGSFKNYPNKPVPVNIEIPVDTANNPLVTVVLSLFF